MSEMTDRARAIASSFGAIITTRKTAARESGASTLCGSIGTRSRVAFAMAGRLLPLDVADQEQGNYDGNNRQERPKYGSQEHTTNTREGARDKSRDSSDG